MWSSDESFAKARSSADIFSIVTGWPEKNAI